MARRANARPRIEPHQTVAGRPPESVDRHRRRVLAGHRHGLHAIAGDVRTVHQPARRVADQRPPLLGVLRRATITRVRRGDRVEFVVEDVAVETHETDLRSTRAQVNAETEFLAHAGGTEACWSIMSAMTARMNSSASALMP